MDICTCCSCQRVNSYITCLMIPGFEHLNVEQTASWRQEGLTPPSVFLFTQSSTRVDDFCSSLKASLALSIKRKRKSKHLRALRARDGLMLAESIQRREMASLPFPGRKPSPHLHCSAHHQPHPGGDALKAGMGMMLAMGMLTCNPSSAVCMDLGRC